MTVCEMKNILEQFDDKLPVCIAEEIPKEDKTDDYIYDVTSVESVIAYEFDGRDQEMVALLHMSETGRIAQNEEE